MAVDRVEIEVILAQGQLDKNVADIENKLNRIKDVQVDADANGLKVVASISDDAVASAKKMQDEYKKAGQAAGGIDDGLKSAVSASTKLKTEASQLDNIFKGIAQGIGQQISGAAFNALGGTIRGVRDTVASSVNTFIDFDEAIKQAGVISGTTGTRGLSDLREEVAELGLVTSKTPAEIAGMTVALSRSGFSAKEQTDALEGIVRASEATGDGLLEVGDIVGKTIRTFTLSADQSESVSDALVATANNTNSSVVGLGESLAYVGPTAAAANQPLEDTLVLLGLLGDAGIQGSSAGTNLAAALERLKIASAGGETEFSNLVRGSKRATDAFNIIGAEVRNADGSMKSVLDVLPVIQSNLDGLGQADQDILFKALFGVEGGRAIQTLLNVTPERLDLISSKVKNAEGVATASGEAMLAGLGGALNLLDGTIQTLATNFGEVFAPGLEAVVRTVNPVAVSLAGLLGAFNDLPAPVRATALGLTAVTAATAAGIVAATAYQLVVGTTAAKLVAENTAKAISTALQIKDTLATTAAAVAKGGYAIATGQATAAQLKFTATLGLGLAKLGLFAAAAASVALVGDTFKSVDAAAAATRTSTIEVEDALVAIAEANAQVASSGEEAQQALEEAASTNLSQIAEGLNPVQSALDKFIRGPIPGIATAAEAATNRSRIAFLDLADEASKVSLAAADVAVDLEKGISVDPAKIEATTNGIDAAIEALQSQKPVTEEDIRLKNAQIEKLQGYKARIEEATAANNQLAGATGDQAAAAAQQVSAIDQATQAIESAANDQALAQANAQANINQQVLDGVLTQEQAAQELVKAERDALNARLAANDAALAQLREANKSASNPAEIEANNAKIQEIETDSAQARADISKSLVDQKIADEEKAADAKVQAEEDAQKRVEEALQSVEDRAASRLSLIEQQANEEGAAIRKLQLDGTKSAQEAEQSISEISAREIQRRISAKKQEQADITSLVSAGTITQEEGNKRLQALELELGGLRIEQLDQAIAKQQQLEQSELDRIAKSIALQEQALSQTQGEATLQIKQQIAQNPALADASETELALTQIAQQGVDARLSIKLSEFDQIREARAQGLIGEEAANTRLAELQDEILSIRTEAADLQIQKAEQVRAAQVQAANDELDAQKRVAESIIQKLSLQEQYIAAQQGSLQSSLGAEQAVASLAVERLNTELARAEASENENKAARLRREIFQAMLEQQDLELDGKQRLLELEAKQAAIKQQQLEITAQIAVAEARAAVAVAEAEGKGEAVLNSLRENIALREQQVELAARQGELTRQQIADDQQRLNAERGIAAEQAKQQAIQEDLGRGVESQAARLAETSTGALAAFDQTSNATSTDLTQAVNQSQASSQSAAASQAPSATESNVTNQNGGNVFQFNTQNPTADASAIINAMQRQQARAQASPGGGCGGGCC